MEREESDKHEWLFVSEVASKWGVSMKTVQRLIKSNRLPHANFGKKCNKVHVSIVEAWQAHAFTAAQPTPEPTQHRTRKRPRPVRSPLAEFACARARREIAAAARERPRHTSASTPAMHVP